MSSCERCILVSVDKISSVVDNTSATGVDQSLDSRLVTCFDDISCSFHIDAEKQFFIALSDSRDWRTGRVYDGRWFDLLKDFSQRGEVRYISTDIWLVEVAGGCGGGRGNIEQRDLAFWVSSSN